MLLCNVMLCSPADLIDDFFAVSNFVQCLYFCRYHPTCEHFEFRPLTSKCGLLSGIPIYEIPTSTDIIENDVLSPKFSISGNEYCIRSGEAVRYGCKTTDCVLQRSVEGLFIQNAWSGRCLSIDETPGKTLKWRTCVSASLWRFELIVQKTSGELHTKVHPANDLSLCLESSLFDGVLLPTLSLSGCSNFMAQVMVLNRSFNFDTFGVQRNFGISGIDLFYLYTDETASETQNPKKSLTDVRFLTYSEIKGPCYHRNLKVKNGKILDETSEPPFYLPDTNLTVQCEEGYGIKKNGFSQHGWFRCENELTQPPRCSKVYCKDWIFIVACNDFYRIMLE